MDQIHQRAQIPPHRLEQRRPPQFRRHHDQRAVADDVVDERTALGELAVGIDVDAFGQPLVDAREVARIREEIADLCQRRRDHPAMIWRVHTTSRHPGPGFHEERLQDPGNLLHAVPAADGSRRGDAVHDEPGVGRRVEIRGRQVDVPVRALRADQEGGCYPESIEEGGVGVIPGLRMHERRGERLDSAARGSGPVQAELIGDAPQPRAGRIGHLRRQERPHGCVVARDGLLDQRVGRLRVAAQSGDTRHAGGADQGKKIPTRQVPW